MVLLMQAAKELRMEGEREGDFVDICDKSNKVRVVVCFACNVNYQALTLSEIRFCR